MNVVPRILRHGFVVQSPGLHFAQGKRHNILAAQPNHERGMAQRFHLINLQRQPEGERSKLNDQAGCDQHDSTAPDPRAHIVAIAEQQRHGKQRRQFHRRRNITITPGKISRPECIPRIKADVAEQQQKRSYAICADFWRQALPQHHQQQNRQHQQRIEKKNRLFRLEQRAQKAFAERSGPRKVCRQRRIQRSLFLCKHRYIGVGKRFEAPELVEPVNHQEKRVHRSGDLAIAHQPLPQLPSPHTFKPKHEQKKNASRHKIEAGGEPRKQVQPERGATHPQRPLASRAQPVILKRESSQRQKHDVVVLHHVLRVMQVRGAEHQRQHAQHGFPHAESQLAKQAKTHQRREHIHQDAGAIADHNAAHRGIVLIPREDPPVHDPRACQIRGQHQQGLSYAIPAIQPASAAVQTELGILVGKYLWLGSPQPVGGLQPVHRVGRPQLARLHHPGEQSCR